jgi:RNA recognition motif-containing protein
MGTKLYVGNLNYNTNEESLRQLFGSNGREVASVSIIMDRETGRSRGFAFVEMTTSEFAQQALQELEGADLDGRALRINEARERDARGPRPGGYAGGGGGAAATPVVVVVAVRRAVASRRARPGASVPRARPAATSARRVRPVAVTIADAPALAVRPHGATSPSAAVVAARGGVAKTAKTGSPTAP